MRGGGRRGGRHREPPRPPCPTGTTTPSTFARASPFCRVPTLPWTSAPRRRRSWSSSRHCRRGRSPGRWASRSRLCARISSPATPRAGPSTGCSATRRPSRRRRRASCGTSDGRSWPVTWPRSWPRSPPGGTRNGGFGATARPADRCPRWRSWSARTRAGVACSRADAAARAGNTRERPVRSAKPMPSGWRAWPSRGRAACASTIAKSCRGYLKTYDGQGNEALLLADWTSLHLDLVAADRGLKRRAASLYGFAPRGGAEPAGGLGRLEDAFLAQLFEDRPAEQDDRREQQRRAEEHEGGEDVRRLLDEEGAAEDQGDGREDDRRAGRAGLPVRKGPSERSGRSSSCGLLLRRARARRPCGPGRGSRGRSPFRP